VVIARLPAGESVVRPRSKCPKCGHQLPWYENIPVISWVALRGKCSSCKAPISPRYVLVELLTATLFLAAAEHFGWDWPLVRALTFLVLLVPLIFIDAEHWVLPFELTLPGIAAGIALAWPTGLPTFKAALVGALVGFMIFRVMEFVGWAVVGREALGAGDKYLLAMIGATLGWRPLLGVVMLSSLQGALFGLIRIRVTGRAGPEAATAASEPQGEEEEPPPGRDPWTPAFLDRSKPAWWRLLVGVPYAIFLQDIPDPPPLDASTGEEPEWVPGTSNMPFGPWIGLAAVEVMFLSTWLVNALADTPFAMSAEVLFG
jgi:leader peptidase (prepilin peptidase) / N-methyltransferase